MSTKAFEPPPFVKHVVSVIVIKAHTICDKHHCTDEEIEIWRVKEYTQLGLGYST